MDNTPSPKSSPKRTRDATPGDSDGYNSPEEKSERVTVRGPPKLRPLLPSPVCPAPGHPADRKGPSLLRHSTASGGLLVLWIRISLKGRLGLLSNNVQCLVSWLFPCLVLIYVLIWLILELL